jgi:hypothetical protein
MRKVPPLTLLLLSFFCIISTTAQLHKSIISDEEIGTLKCFYIKQERDNQVLDFAIQIIFKNQQFVYKQEQDTIFIKSKDQIAKFISDLQAGLLVISDEEKEYIITNSNYTLFKHKGFSDNNFIVIANKGLTIKTPINKFFTNQLINWLKAIDFGKG